MPTNPETPPRLVVLMKCGRQTCSHVFVEEERAWKPCDHGTRAICPKCAEESYYYLNEKGQTLKQSERAAYWNGLDPNLIEPSPRMGPKMKRYILRAKRFALTLPPKIDEKQS